jgi:CysZ protein
VRETTATPGFVEGLEAFVGGVNFILTTPSVWLHALVPALLVLFLACALGWLGVWGAGRAADAIVGQTTGYWSALGSWLLTVVFALAAVVFALLLAVVLAQPLSVFSLEAIVRAQERALGVPNASRLGLLQSFLLSLGVAIFTVCAAVPIYTLLFICVLVFPPATAVTVPLKVLISAWLLAWNFLDYPLALRGLGLRTRLHWIWDRPGAFTGFGLAWAIVLVVPGMALLLLPMGVAGATRLVVGQDVSAEDWR